MATGYNVHRQLTWAWLLSKGFRLPIVLYMLLEVACMALGLSFVYWSKQAVDVATQPGELSFGWEIIFMVVSVVAGILLGQLSSYVNEWTSIRLTIRLQNSLVSSQMQSVWENVKRFHTGDLQVRLHTDSKEAVQMVVFLFPNLCVTCIRLLASWFFLWTLDASLAVMILALSPLFLLSKVYYRKMRRLSKEVKESESQLGVVLQENLKQRLLIRALGVVSVRRRKYLERQVSIYTLKGRLLKFSVFTQLLLKIIFNSGYLLAFLWGIFSLHSGAIPFGTLTAFLQLVGRVQEPILSMIAFVPAAIRCRATFERLMELQEGAREMEGIPVRVHHPVALQLNDVSFGYEDAKLIDGLNAELKAGVPTAIVGATGKGKTTLIRLMLALIAPQEGTVRIVGEAGDVAIVSPQTRINISYVPQGNTLFSGTIRENLLMASPKATEGQLEEVLALSCAEFVYALPKGLDTWVGESGHGLSEGQAQRLAIARAMLHGGDIWVFDEATSALDAATAVRLTNHLLEAGREKIVIFVTHDPSLMNACSQIIRLDQ